MSVNSISKKITLRIARELKLSSEKQAIIEYGLISLLSQMMTIFLLLIIAYGLNIVIETIVIGLCSAILRRYSGGAHCSSPLRCSLLSIIVVPILVLLAKLIFELQPIIHIAFILTMNLFSIIIYIVYAPQDTPTKPIKNESKIRNLKFKSFLSAFIILIICTSLLYFNFPFIAILMTLGVLNQSLTLTKVGKSYINQSDRILKIVIP